VQSTVFLFHTARFESPGESKIYQNPNVCASELIEPPRTM
jgi:hypothetical protein